MPLSTFQEIDSHIQRWMSEERWIFSKIDNHTYRKGYAVSLKDKKEIGVIIEKIDCINIQKIFLISSDAQTSYKLSPTKYEFLYDLKIHLMLMGVIAEFLPSYEKLEAIDIYEKIYFDGFSRDRFIHSVLKIADAMELCAILWKEFTESSQDLQ